MVFFFFFDDCSYSKNRTYWLFRLMKHRFNRLSLSRNLIENYTCVNPSYLFRKDNYHRFLISSLVPYTLSRSSSSWYIYIYIYSPPDTTWAYLTSVDLTKNPNVLQLSTVVLEGRLICILDVVLIQHTGLKFTIQCTNIMGDTFENVRLLFRAELQFSC